MTNLLRAGLVGCGSVALRGLLPHLTLPDAKAKVHLAAVVDVDRERAQQTAAKFGVPAYFTSIDDLLAKGDVDLVLIATPIPYHFSNAMSAIEAGKHVYLQKTMTTTLAEANTVLAARNHKGVKLAAACGYELFPTTKQMRDVVQRGELGRVNVAYTYTMGFGHEREPIRSGKGALAEISPAWYYQPGAGPLPDVTVYAFHLITSVLGPVRKVTSLANRTADERVWQGETIRVNINDNSMVMMEFASGTIGMAVGTKSRGSPRIPWGALGLYGTLGGLEVTATEALSGFPTHFEVWGQTEQSYASTLADQPYIQGEHVTIEEPQAYADIMDLVDAIYEDRAPLAGGEQAAHVVEIIEKSLIAVATGQTQMLESTF
ncbi:MAG: gfo/Idh/MocA family oxidoreductase [Caldilinea sp. CFX5]|nr:gfo/Idh/MocA family oxidoreductase [Caldilinea sp. CFX5]